MKELADEIYFTGTDGILMIVEGCYFDEDTECRDYKRNGIYFDGYFFDENNNIHYGFYYDMINGATLCKLDIIETDKIIDFQIKNGANICEREYWCVEEDWILKWDYEKYSYMMEKIDDEEEDEL